MPKIPVTLFILKYFVNDLKKKKKWINTVKLFGHLFLQYGFKRILTFIPHPHL